MEELYKEVESGTFKGWIYRYHEEDKYYSVEKYKGNKQLFSFNIDADSPMNLSNYDLEQACANEIANVVIDVIFDYDMLKYRHSDSKSFDQSKKYYDLLLGCIKEVPDDFYKNRNNIDAISSLVSVKTEEQLRKITSKRAQETAQRASKYCTFVLQDHIERVNLKHEQQQEVAKSIRNDFSSIQF